jgi:hypothetical protein
LRLVGRVGLFLLQDAWESGYAAFPYVKQDATK